MFSLLSHRTIIIIIDLFERINDNNGFNSFYFDFVGELETLVEDYIDEICNNSKTLTKNKFNDEITLCDLSAVNALSLVKWYNKNIYII
jgi:hypothetical protein